MRHIQCNLCGSDKYAVINSHRKDRYCRPEVEVRTVICKTCGLVYVNPQLDDSELHSLYSTTYGDAPAELTNRKKLERKEIAAEWSVRWIYKRAGISDKLGKVLDIGCGMGALPHAFQKRGWDAYGVEPTPHGAQFAKERFGVKIMSGFLEDTHLPSSYFDLVTLVQTFEHLADPSQALIIIRNCLKDEGLIYINSPNILKPKHFQPFEAPHLYTYSPNTLRLLLKKAGFEPIVIEGGRNALALARKGRSSRIDFSSEGDDYRKIMGSLKWRYPRLTLQFVWERLDIAIGFLIRHIFGQERGRKIIKSIKRLLLGGGD